MKMLQSRPGGVNENAGPPDLTKEQICAAIKSKQPPGCTTKPSIAGLNGSANGCGSGTWSRLLGGVYLSLNYPLSYTGSIDAPAAGASFLSSCNSHDYCYARQAMKATCDTQFSNDLKNACSTATNPTSCNAFADEYYTAVNTPDADNAYAAAGGDLAGYKYQKEVDDNGCPK